MTTPPLLIEIVNAADSGLIYRVASCDVNKIVHHHVMHMKIKTSSVTFCTPLMIVDQHVPSVWNSLKNIFFFKVVNLKVTFVYS